MSQLAGGGEAEAIVVVVVVLPIWCSKRTTRYIENIEQL